MSTASYHTKKRPSLVNNHAGLISRRLFLVLALVLSLCVFPVASFAETTTTTTTTTTLPITTTTIGGLDAPLPGETTIPAAQTKQQSVAQENAKKANSKLDAATKKLLDAQLAADITTQDIQTTKALLADLKDKIEKNEALIAIRALPLRQLSKIIKKRAVTMYQESDGTSTDAMSQFYQNKVNALAGTAQNANVTELKVFRTEQEKLEKYEAELQAQKTDADVKAAHLEELSVQFAAQLETAKKEYEKNATLFLDANAIIGARLAIDGKMCPIAGPLTHTPDWGNVRSGGRTHKGNDIFNAFGTPNVAIVAGRIEHNMDDLGGMGVNLFADDGTMYYYAHLSAYAGENRRVNQGDVIGYSGDSGNAKGGAPHTHFEIRLGGSQRVDPYPLLRIICGA